MAESETPSRIPGIPLPHRKKAKVRRVTTSIEWIERGPLAPWMYSYCLWLAQDPNAVLVKPDGHRLRRHGPTTQERTAKAGLLSKRKIPQRYIRALESREDFRAYFDKLRADHAFLAREHAKQKIVKNLEMRDLALDRATGRVEMPDGTVKHGEVDIKAVEQLTRPYVELAFPKKEPEGEKAPRVVIHLGGQALQQLMGAPQQVEATDVEFEVLENPKALESGEED
jgi:hypothetical protein